MRALATFAFVVLIAVTAAVWWHETARRAAVASTPGAMDIARSLGAGAASGFARANEPRTFSFPADHGPHPHFKQEWWYYTGNLRDAAGRRFGFELTFFRIALAPSAVKRSSSWATNTVYMAHFAVSDIDAHHFYSSQRVERAALGLAGAQATPFKVWLDDWHVVGRADATHFVADLHAAAAPVALDLHVESLGPPVLQGDHGLSRKSAQTGNASYYYSLPRLTTQGTIHIGPHAYAVSGLAWMDREWSTSALAPNEAGWDWFALQLSDGTEVMLYRLRHRDGTIDPYSAGSFIVGSRMRPLAVAQMRLRVTDSWKSPHTGARYPSGWILDIPSLALHLTIRPFMHDQELLGLVHYWEGAVAIHGTRAGSPISGSGYAELTGYNP